MISKLLPLTFNLFCLSVAYSDTRIGVIVPLTGPLAEYGVAIKNGIEVAKEDEPSLFKECKFLFEDSQYDPKAAIGAYRKLCSQDSASIIYNFGGPTSASIAPLVDKSRIPTFFWSTDPNLTTQSSYAIRFTNSELEYATALVNALKAKNIERIAIVVTENEYLNSILAGLSKSLQPSQTVTIVDTFHPQDLDFKRTIIKLKRETYDAVGVFLLSGQIGLFYRQMKELDASFSSFGTDFFESSSEIKIAGDKMDGAVYANNQASESFMGRYQQKFKNDSQITYAANSYDFARLACSTLRATTPELIMNSLKNTIIRKGVLGDFKFIETESGDKYFRFPIVIKQIGALKPIKQ